jgi:hypothetical protein
MAQGQGWNLNFGVTGQTGGFLHRHLMISPYVHDWAWQALLKIDAIHARVNGKHLVKIILYVQRDTGQCGMEEANSSESGSHAPINQVNQVERTA